MRPRALVRVQPALEARAREPRPQVRAALAEAGAQAREERRCEVAQVEVVGGAEAEAEGPPEQARQDAGHEACDVGREVEFRVLGERVNEGEAGG